MKLKKYQQQVKSISDESSEYDSSSSDSSPTLNPSGKESRAFSITDEQTKDIMNMLRQSMDLDEWELKQENKYDNTIDMDNLLNQLKNEDNDTEEDEDDWASNAEDRKDEIRIARLEETRPVWFTRSLKILFHVCVFVNFFMSWYDSTRLILEDSKMNAWLLQDDYNCLEIVPKVDWLDHTMNILHALLSAAVLYVHNRRNATLCLAWIGSQACHTMFKTFQYFYNLKFETKGLNNQSDGLILLIAIVLLDVFCALILLHKYYDLTDRFRTRAKYFASTATNERSLNDKIINKNESAFLQRKNVLRLVTTSQTFAIIKKIGNHAKQGIHVDTVTLDREINAARLALRDCQTAETPNMPSVVIKACAQHLKELEEKHKDKGETFANKTDIY